MKIKALFTSLFAIGALATGQLSFGMKKPNKIILKPVVCAPHKTTILNLSDKTLDGIAHHPTDTNKILFKVRQGYCTYDLKNNRIEDEKFTNKIPYSPGHFPNSGGPYFFSYRDNIDDKTLIIKDKITTDPLYVIKHKEKLKFAMLSDDFTKLITGSEDNEVRISTIKKPIIIKLGTTSIACNSDVACMSQMIKEKSSSNTDTVSLTLEPDQFKFTYHLMTLLYNSDSKTINTFLESLDINTLCKLVTTCEYLNISKKDDINLIHTICQSISKRYNPTTDFSYVTTLSPSLQSIILKPKKKTDKTIPKPVVCAPQKINGFNFSEETLDGIASHPTDKNKILFKVRKGYYAYDLKNDSIEKFSEQIPYEVRRLPDADTLYSYSRRDNDGKTLTINDRKTTDPLYAVKHKGKLIFVTTFENNTKLITGSEDGEVRISTIKKPIIIKLGTTSIACNSDVACMSQKIKESSSNTDPISLSFEPNQFRNTYHLMTLLYNSDSESINSFLESLDMNTLCKLVAACEYLNISKKDDINLTQTICQSISKQYNPETDRSFVTTLSSDLQLNILKLNRKADTDNTTDLSKFCSKPFINKHLLWGGIIGSFATAAIAGLFCYYQYFKRLPRIF